MIEFDVVRKGYDKEQVEEYLALVKTEYNKLYDEYMSLFEQYKELQSRYEECERTAAKLQSELHSTSLVPKKQMESIALALIDAETEARRIVNAARDKAWKIITDAKKDLAADTSGEPVKKQKQVYISTASVSKAASPIKLAEAGQKNQTAEQISAIDKLLASLEKRS